VAGPCEHGNEPLRAINRGGGDFLTICVTGSLLCSMELDGWLLSCITKKMDFPCSCPFEHVCTSSNIFWTNRLTDFMEFDMKMVTLQRPPRSIFTVYNFISAVKST
jgi:hypothetical protein